MKTRKLSNKQKMVLTLIGLITFVTMACDGPACSSYENEWDCVSNETPIVNGEGFFVNAARK